jgi:predicted nucleic acid-binding protein
MADRFFDTSATVKHYLPEIGTAKVDSLLAEVSARHFLSELGVVELQSVFARQVRTGQITVADFALFRGRFLADIASGLWTVLPVTGRDFHFAQQPLARHGLTRSLRTLDAIQLAVAVAQHATAPLHAFVCADLNLNHLASSDGLAVLNPEIP